MTIRWKPRSQNILRAAHPRYILVLVGDMRIAGIPVVQVQTQIPGLPVPQVPIVAQYHSRAIGLKIKKTLRVHH
jgi:hypothetical protein